MNENYLIIPNDTTTFVLFLIMTFCIVVMALIRIFELFNGMSEQDRFRMEMRRKLDELDIHLSEIKRKI